MKPVSGSLIFVVGNFDLVMGPPASNAFMISPPFRHQKLFLDKIYFVHASSLTARSVVVGGLQGWMECSQFLLATHPVVRPTKCDEHPPQSVWSFPTSSASSLDQRFFFHAARKDPIAGMSPRRVLLCSAFFLRSTTMTIARDWRTSGAAIDPNDLQFSRGCFDGSPGAAVREIGPGTTAD
jgi:hypothetical protein